MKICLVGPTYPFRGGISHYTTLLSRELGKRHEVSLISLRAQYPKLLFPGRTQTDRSRDVLSVANDPLLAPLEPWSWMRAARRISALRPDLVLFQWWQPFFAPCFGTMARLLRARRIPTSFLCHNVEAHERSVIDGILTRYALGSSSRFITHSQRDRRALEHVLPRARVHVSPLPSFTFFREGAAMVGDAGVAISRSDARSSLGLDDRDVILFFGNIRRYKGLPILLRALPSVLERRACQLLVVGEFYHQEEEARALIRELGMEGHILIVDRYVPNEEVGLYFGAADLIVLPYLSASQSGIVPIAYSFQRPVIVTSVGGLPEVVDHEVTGLLVPPGDPQALAGSICRFFEEEMGPRMARNIAERQHLFSWERMVAAVESLVPGTTAMETAPADEEKQRAA